MMDTSSSSSSSSCVVDNAKYCSIDSNNNNSNDLVSPYYPQPASHAQTTYHELCNRSQSDPLGHSPTRPLDFPSPRVKRGVRVKVLAYHPATGERKLIGVIHRAEFLPGSSVGAPPISSSSSGSISTATPRLGNTTPGNNGSSTPGGTTGGGNSNAAASIIVTPNTPASPPPPTTLSPQMCRLNLDHTSHVAYWPQRRLQDAIYGCVIACSVLIKHVGEASDAAARAAGYTPGHPHAPIVWEITNELVAIKQVEWKRVHAMRGRLLEDPIKEIAAMQLIGNAHPNVLGSMEVLQDNDHLYSVMPYCRGGDLFGVVLEVSETRQANEAVEGAGGMSEPVARYWFRQLLLGLHYLQSRGVCHRDLSLENILVDIHHCLVIDMGMCLRVPYHNPADPTGKATDVEHGSDRRLMVPMGTCGKKNYMSPEIYENKNHFDGFAVDLWSAGVILYIMVTGFPPYDTPSREDERFEIICQGGLMSQLRAWEIRLSEEVGDLLQWMLSPNPIDRPSLAQVMMHDWVIRGEVRPPL